MTALPYTLEALNQKSIGLIVLQSDETIEQDFRKIMPDSVNLHVSRVPSGLEFAIDARSFACSGRVVAANIAI